jgi:hypothetical protein
MWKKNKVIYVWDWLRTVAAIFEVMFGKAPGIGNVRTDNFALRPKFKYGYHRYTYDAEVSEMISPAE